MAKSRIDRRGKIRSLVQRARPGKKLHWRKQKTLAALANKKQWIGEFDPQYTSDTEILTGEGYGIKTEASITGNPIYIILE